MGYPMSVCGELLWIGSSFENNVGELWGQLGVIKRTLRYQSPDPPYLEATHRNRD